MERVKQELNTLRKELADGKISVEGAEIGYATIIANYGERVAAEACARVRRDMRIGSDYDHRLTFTP